MYYLLIMCQVICWFVYIGKNPRFTAFLGSNLHTRLAIVTENELGLAFPPRNLPKKIRPDPFTLPRFLVDLWYTLMVTKSTTNPQQVRNKPTINRMPTTNPQQAVHQIERIQQVLELDYYPRGNKHTNQRR